MDLAPVNTGQILVVPIQHAACLGDSDEETTGHLMKVAHRLATSLRMSGLPCEGINLFLSDGEVAMQEVFHVHLHVIPRFADDGFGLKYGPQNFVRRNRADLDDAAASIRQAMARQ